MQANINQISNLILNKQISLKLCTAVVMAICVRPAPCECLIF